MWSIQRNISAENFFSQSIYAQCNFIKCPFPLDCTTWMNQPLIFNINTWVLSKNVIEREYIIPHSAENFHYAKTVFQCLKNTLRCTIHPTHLDHQNSGFTHLCFFSHFTYNWCYAQLSLTLSPMTMAWFPYCPHSAAQQVRPGDWESVSAYTSHPHIQVLKWHSLIFVDRTAKGRWGYKALLFRHRWLGPDQGQWGQYKDRETEPCVRFTVRTPGVKWSGSIELQIDP